MPVLRPALFPALASPAIQRSAESAGPILQVVCAWPVSGQYGPGSRVLYYVLVAACVLARKADWLRNACLAAALLFPAVAAMHGIILAALHVDGAVDMDVYGAFQLCAVGVLAAPVTARLSSTYFNDPGRNIIFLWTILLLAGLLSLTVEFYRSSSVDCAASPFDYTQQPQCGISHCVQGGPLRSPLRQGATGDVYVILAPDRLTFGTATLLAAGCCIPAILSLVSMWSKILETNWKSRFGPRDADERIDGTKATEGRMRGVNEVIRRFLSVVEVPIFGAAVLAILVVGENNFFSYQMRYRTEPIASVGQWAPIVGTVLATAGSLYLLWASSTHSPDPASRPDAFGQHCGDSGHDSLNQGPTSCSCTPASVQDPPIPAMQDVGIAMSGPHLRSATTPRHGIPGPPSRRSVESSPGGTFSSPSQQNASGSARPGDEGGRLRVAKAITAVADYIGTASPDRFDDSAFQHGDASDFPEIPGEEQRNRGLQRIRLSYNQTREDDADDAPLSRRPRSRAASFNGSIASRRAASGHSVRVSAASGSAEEPRDTGSPVIIISNADEQPGEPRMHLSPHGGANP